MFSYGDFFSLDKNHSYENFASISIFHNDLETFDRLHEFFTLLFFFSVYNLSTCYTNLGSIAVKKGDYSKGLDWF